MGTNRWDTLVIKSFTDYEASAPIDEVDDEADPATRTYHSYILSGTEYKEVPLISIEIHAGCTISIDLDKAMAALRD